MLCRLCSRLSLCFCGVLSFVLVRRNWFPLFFGFLLIVSFRSTCSLCFWWTSPTPCWIRLAKSLCSFSWRSLSILGRSAPLFVFFLALLVNAVFLCSSFVLSVAFVCPFVWDRVNSLSVSPCDAPTCIGAGERLCCGGLPLVSNSLSFSLLCLSEDRAFLGLRYSWSGRVTSLGNLPFVDAYSRRVAAPPCSSHVHE